MLDAEKLLLLCEQPLIEKVRYTVKIGNSLTLTPPFVLTKATAVHSTKSNNIDKWKETPSRQCSIRDVSVNKMYSYFNSVAI